MIWTKKSVLQLVCFSFLILILILILILSLFSLFQAAGEPQWVGAGQAPGLQIWRIEKFRVVPWPPHLYGQFHTGDSYIVLHTYHRHPRTTALAWDIYFWLGSETTQDEAGTAAYKTVELDDSLGGAPVQHREVQSFESPRFLQLFPGGMIQILAGGVETGFNIVKPEEYQPRLLHAKGIANNVRIEQVALHCSSMNSGDVFILDAGMKIWQWVCFRFNQNYSTFLIFNFFLLILERQRFIWS